MAYQEIQNKQNGEKGLSARMKINAMFQELYSLIIVKDYVTVGIGGDFPTFALAFSASKTRLKLVSNITENVTIDIFCVINFDGYTITGSFTNNVNNIILRDFVITGNFVNNADYCIFKNVRCNKITNNVVADNCIFENIFYTVQQLDSSASTRKWDVYLT